MRRYYQALGCFVWLMLLQACASTDSQPDMPSIKPSHALVLLEKNLASWRGTPYRLGGSNRAGIDCSAFVQQAYKAVYGVNLPRTTQQQSSLGKRVKRHYQTGDLILFKTSFKTRHIGIYLDRQRFMHASTSQGVMISSLDNPYWRKHFWQARRL